MYVFVNGQSDDYPKLKVLGIAGSLRRGSYNRGLLRAAKELAPDRMEIEILDLDAIPFYNQDVEDQGDPAAVAEMKQAISEADALLIATPEYQYGVPGVLKNAIDWASRPPADSVMNEKPVAVMGATPGLVGTARAQLQLRQTLAYNRCRILPRPEILVARTREKFDDDSRLTDGATRTRIRKLLARLYNWTLFQTGEIGPGEKVLVVEEC